MFRPIAIWSYRLMLLIALVACAMQSYRNKVTYELFQIEWSAHSKAIKVFEEGVRSDIDAMYRTLYTDPDKVVPVTEPPPPPRTPSYVELWQRNRDKELRDRINRLEQWRLRLESQR